MNILGLDLSLTAPGFAVDLGPHALRPPKVAGAERLAWFDDYIRRFTISHKVNFAVIEGYAFGSKWNREALGELGGVVKLALHQLAIPFVTVAPTAVKKYATGKGNATKDVMLASAIKRSGLDIQDNNAADAWWLYQMGLMHFHPNSAVFVPALHQDALKKVEWPS